MAVCITSRSSSSTLISCGDGVVVGASLCPPGGSCQHAGWQPFSCSQHMTGGFVGPSTERACWGLLDLFKRYKLDLVCRCGTL
jgi:hypothetical protein